MSDDRPRNEPLPEEDWQDAESFHEEAVYAGEDEFDEWDDEMAYDDAIEEPYDDVEDLDASIYEPPEPPITDAEFEAEEPPEDEDNWFKRNWRALVLAALVVIIVALVFRACTGRTKKPTPTPLPTATLAPLPTFTPTAVTDATSTPPGAPLAGSPSETPTSSVPAESTPPPIATQPPPPPPSGEGGISVGMTVIVTGTGKDRLSLREKPTIKAARVKLIKDGVKLTIIAGPKKADGYTWWKVRTPKGIEGWAVADYLKPMQ